MKTTALRLLMLYSATMAAAAAALAPHGHAQATLAEAEALRDASSEAWKQKDFQTASKRLQEAHAIYVTLDGDHVGARSVCCRAIVWNEVDLGQLDTAFEWLTTLAQLAKQHDTVGDDLTSAYTAIAGYAARQTDFDVQEALTERARKIFQRNDQRGLAAQCLHDLGGYAGGAGDLRAMKQLYDRAIKERRPLGDVLGIAWSQNNTAYHYLQHNHLREALDPLAAITASIADGQVPDCQRAVSINLESAFAALLAEPPTREAVKWGWKIADTLAASTTPFIFPPDRAVRSALALEAARDAKSAKRAAGRAARTARKADWPDAVRADIMIRAAEVATRHDDTPGAQSYLDQIQIDAGPCAPHLQARLETVRAAIAARRGEAQEFDRLARDAVAKTDAVGHLSQRIAALALLTEREVDGSEALAELRAAADDLRRAGKPGGAGGSAMSSGAGQIPENAGPHFVACELSWDAEAERIVLHDRIGGSTRHLEVRWHPHGVTINGIGLHLLGGYVTVRSMNYGGGAGASGSAGMATLDQMGDYLPITAGGVWQVTLNGAVQFQPQR